MGYTVHHTIIVTSWDDDRIVRAHDFANACFSELAPVSAIYRTSLNGYSSFAIFTDGSKEGWPDSDAGDKARAVFRGLAEKLGVDVAEVRYGGDFGADSPPEVVP